jgi:iron complex outermembrane receptor protein
MKPYRTLPFFLITLLNTTFSIAQNSKTPNSSDAETESNYILNDTVKNKRGEILQEVIVNQQKNIPSVIRSGIKPLDLPQSLQVIGSIVIEQQQSVRLSDVIRNANGVYVGSARGGAQESFWSRGYDMSANNMFKNGFRFNSGSMPEVSSLEKVEILRGSSALLYGNVSPGGILNMVTKAPLFVKGGELSMQAGSYSFYKPTLDVYGPLNDIIAYRFIGSYENSESFRDVVKRERFYINPSVLFKMSSKTELTLQADYLNDDWTPDFGTGIIGRAIADVPRNRYLGAKWSNGLTKQATASALLNHNFNENWKLNFNTSFQNYSRTFEGTERIQPSENGDWDRPLVKNKALEQIIGEQISLEGTFFTGKVKHQLFTGADVEYSFTQAYTFSNGIYDKINIFDLSLYPQETFIPVATNTQTIKTTTNRYGVYAQDLISITEKFKVLAGIRWSLQEAKPVTYKPKPDTNPVEGAKGAIRNDVAFSPKLGLIYRPLKNLSLFTSYANSFTPNTGMTIFNEALEPSIIDQYEIGVKKEFWAGGLSTNVTLYQITNSNLAQMAEFNADGTPNKNPDRKTLSGETTSKGVEIDITSKPVEGLNIMAGYSYNDMRYTKTTGATGSFIEGDRLVRTPQNTANFSAFYTLQQGRLKGVSFGTIANYMGERLGGWNYTNGQINFDRIPIPLSGYTTIDFSLGYNWKQFSVLCRLSNVTNELNYTVHENYSVNPIAPRQIMTTVRYKF